MHHLGCYFIPILLRTQDHLEIVVEALRSNCCLSMSSTTPTCTAVKSRGNTERMGFVKIKSAIQSNDHDGRLMASFFVVLAADGRAPMEVIRVADSSAGLFSNFIVGR